MSSVRVDASYGADLEQEYALDALDVFLLYSDMLILCVMSLVRVRVFSYHRLPLEDLTSSPAAVDVLTWRCSCQLATPQSRRSHVADLDVSYFVNSRPVAGSASIWCSVWSHFADSRVAIVLRVMTRWSASQQPEMTTITTCVNLAENLTGVCPGVLKWTVLFWFHLNMGCCYNDFLHV